MGNDYYITNEHRVSADGTTRSSGEVFGYHVITSQYYSRYKLPVMHTETNLVQGRNGNEAVNWLWKEWAGRWGADAGIDLVAEDYDGRLWAIQAKAYAPDNTITKADVDKFLAESSRTVFSYRLLLAPTAPVATRPATFPVSANCGSKSKNALS